MFDVHQGSRLTLNNVSFSSNTTKDGERSGAPIFSFALKIFSLATNSAAAATVQLYFPKVPASFYGTSLRITGFTLDDENPLIGVGAGVAMDASAVDATNSPITVDN